MNILVTNDDGIEAEGIRQLADALAEIADVYVFAPQTQRSAEGHGITMGRPIPVREVTFPRSRMAFAVDGMPADCVKLGLDLLRSNNVVIDRVFSGINHGGNLGTDAIYSGTVAAAIEGSLCGLPSAAFSINSLHPLQFDTAKKLAVRAVNFDFEAYDPRLVLNINVPDLPETQIKGIKLTEQGLREYAEEFKRVDTEDGGMAFYYSGYPVYYEKLNCDSNDVGAYQEGYISITPLHFDLTNHHVLKKLLGSGLDAGL